MSLDIINGSVPSMVACTTDATRVQHNAQQGHVSRNRKIDRMCNGLGLYVLHHVGMLAG